MKEHPLLFKAEMVRAILAGKKTQTRRIIKLRPDKKHPEWPIQPLDILPMKTGPGYVTLMTREPEAHGGWIDYPLGVGDHFWVKETWKFLGTDMNKLGRTHMNQEGVFLYKADNTSSIIERPAQDIEQYMKSKNPDKWISPLFMRQWISRISLEILKVSVERIQDITEEDARAEGVRPMGMLRVKEMYKILWDSINTKSGFGWDANPFVWKIEFRRVAK